MFVSKPLPDFFYLKCHIHLHHSSKKIKCDISGKDYSRKDALIRHKKMHEKNSNKHSINLEESFVNKFKATDIPGNLTDSQSNDSIETEEAFNAVMKNFWLENTEGFLEMKLFLNHLKLQVMSVIERLKKVNEISEFLVILPL